METMLELKGKSPVIDSRVLAREFNQEHRILYKLIMSHREALERFGVLHLAGAKPKTGRTMNIALLTEEQALMLLTYTKAREETDRLRHKLISEFSMMKKALLEISLNRQNQQWLSNRDQGKLQRKSTTDSIQSFIDYAESQGSKNARRYYGNISKMENSSLFLIIQKFPNMREVMDNRQLSFIQSADTIVQEAIREGMEKDSHYKDIYQLCKARIESFSELIPRTTIPIGITQ